MRKTGCLKRQFRCMWSHGRWEGWVLQASPLKSEDWYRLSVFFPFSLFVKVLQNTLTKGHSWYCFLSVPSAEFMTYDTVQKRAMTS